MKGLKAVFSCVLGIVLAINCQLAESAVVNLDEQQARLISREKMKGLLLETLKDPYSADVKIVKESPKSGEIKILCGLVNSKNSYGAYTGFSKFYVRDDEVTYVANDGAFEYITNLAWNVCEYADKRR